ncbi:MAG: hypothetical protein NTW01_15370 [Gammaproteobacteria bacterium]|nr:hypothetical protein [Gammaproteobacteria bacterium]
MSDHFPSTYGEVSDTFSWVLLGVPDFAFANQNRGSRAPVTTETAFDDLMRGVSHVRARMNRPEAIALFDECLLELEITRQLCLSGNDLSGQVVEGLQKLLRDHDLFRRAYKMRRGPKVVHMKPPFLSEEEDPDADDPDFEP